MQPEQTTTPLRQLYYVVQMMLIDPGNAENMKPTFESMCLALLASLENKQLSSQLLAIRDLVTSEKKPFVALKCIRELYPIEAEIMSGGRAKNALGS